MYNYRQRKVKGSKEQELNEKEGKKDDNGKRENGNGRELKRRERKGI